MVLVICYHALLRNGLVKVLLELENPAGKPGFQGGKNRICASERLTGCV